MLMIMPLKKGATQKSCILFNLINLVHFLALKGRNIPAQGNALGKTSQ